MESYDSVKDEVSYRPLGGTIEFGERGQETVIRELREEIGAEVTNLRFLGVLENFFTLEGALGHEIVLAYEGDLVDKSFYERDAVPVEEDFGMTFTAFWKPLDMFREGTARLYPHGLLELLEAKD